MEKVNRKPKNCCLPNCGECPYEDCKYSQLVFEDYTNAREEERKQKMEQEIIDGCDYRREWEIRNYERARANKHRHYMEHRSEYREKNKQYYQKHKDEVLQNSKNYISKNRGMINARAREFKRKKWEENPEYYRQKQREYREKLKDNLPHCDECEECLLVQQTKSDRYTRLCTRDVRLIETKVSNSPRWCYKRKDGNG